MGDKPVYFEVSFYVIRLFFSENQTDVRIKLIGSRQVKCRQDAIATNIFNPNNVFPVFLLNMRKCVKVFITTVCNKKTFADIVERSTMSANALYSFVLWSG